MKRPEENLSGRFVSLHVPPLNGELNTLAAGAYLRPNGVFITFPNLFFFSCRYNRYNRNIFQKKGNKMAAEIEKTASEKGNIDPVIQIVRKSARQYGFYNGGPIGQQILLLGESFYGYRFTAKEYTAVWSAADNLLNLFDRNGKHLGSSLIHIDTNRSIQLQSIMPKTRRAA
jgi:hypothetical protein